MPDRLTDERVREIAESGAVRGTEAVALESVALAREVLEHRAAVPRLGSGARDDGIDVEYEVRKLWWLGHGHAGVYGDDGEMQCSECLEHGFGVWDYKRAPLADVRATYLAARRNAAGSGAREGERGDWHGRIEAPDGVTVTRITLNGQEFVPAPVRAATETEGE